MFRPPRVRDRKRNSVYPNKSLTLKKEHMTISQTLETRRMCQINEGPIFEMTVCKQADCTATDTVALTSINNSQKTIYYLEQHKTFSNAYCNFSKLTGNQTMDKN